MTYRRPKRLPHPQSAAPLTAIALFILLIGSSCGDDGESSAHVKIMDFELTCKTEGDSLTVEVFAPVQGWVAVGFEPRRRMEGADLAIGYVDDAGVTWLRDDFGTGATSHDADVSLGGTDDLVLVSGEQTEAGTRIVFSRPLASDDTHDSSLEVGKRHTVLLAASDTDGFAAQHTRYVSFAMKLDEDGAIDDD
jgi:hypothetical protein